MENRSHLVAALAFIVVFGAGAVAFFFWLSTGDGANRTLVIRTQHAVGGVTSESPVKFKGLKVGHIESVGFAPDDPNTVRIVFKIRDSVPLTRTSYAELSTQGITGLSTLTLATPDPSAPPLTAGSDKPAELPLHQGLFAQLKDRGQQDLERISRILDQVEQLTGGDNARHISRTFAQLDQATAQLTKTEQALQPTLAQLPRLTEQLRQTVDRVDRLTQQAGPVMRQAQGVGKSGQQVMRRLNQRILPHIDALTEQLRDTSRQIQDLGAELTAKPQSVLLGPPARQPGPGEPGFHAPGQ